MLLALVSLVAWVSLGVQVRRLIGSHGLLPLADYIESAREAGVARWARLPTVFLWTQSDGALVGGIGVGVGLSLLALVGIGRRLCFALLGALYLSYAVAGRAFLGFQWDNLLLESCLLATFLPTTRPSPVAHFLFRALLFKLYFESGLAKWQSPLGDPSWRDGSAGMTHYYGRTAPLPAALAYRAHHLPVWWHHLESRATLRSRGTRRPVRDLRPPARGASRRRERPHGVLPARQRRHHGELRLLPATSAAAAARGSPARRRGSRACWPLRPCRAPQTPAVPTSADTRAFDRAAAGAGVAAYLALSLAEAAFVFGGGDEPSAALTALASPLVEERAETLRLVNTYHLVAAITRERIEPEFQTLDDDAWRAQDLVYKPGAPERAPRFVAPHQPRLDFQLWFHGLAYQRGQPPYVHMLLERMCEDAAAVRPLFRDPLPQHPRAVRVVYWQYHFDLARREARDGGVVAPRAPRRDAPRRLRGHAMTAAASTRAPAGPRSASLGTLFFTVFLDLLGFEGLVIPAVPAGPRA